MDQLGHIYVEKTDLIFGGRREGFFWIHVIHMGKTNQGCFMHVNVLIIMPVEGFVPLAELGQYAISDSIA